MFTGDRKRMSNERLPRLHLYKDVGSLIRQVEDPEFIGRNYSVRAGEVREILKTGVDGLKRTHPPIIHIIGLNLEPWSKFKLCLMVQIFFKFSTRRNRSWRKDKGG